MTDQTFRRIKLFSAFFAIYFIWGTTYLAIKYAVETIPPFMMMGMRSVIAGGTLYIYGRFRGDSNPSRNELPSLLLIGTLFFLIGHGVLAWAQQTVPSGVTALLVASEPVIIAVFEPVFTREGRVGKRTLLGMLIGICGIAILVIPQGLDFKNANLLGSFGIIIAASAWSGGAIYSRVARIPRSPFITGGIQLLFGGALLIITSYISGELSHISLSAITVRSWMGLAYLIVFGSVVAFSAYTWLLTVTTATRISTHTFINPVIAILAGWMFAGEALTKGMVIAAMLIGLSVYLVLFRKK